MNRRDAAKLGTVLAATDRPTAPSEGYGSCGLCDCRLTAGGEDPIVEVALGPGTERPEAWLCRACYGYVVGDLGIAPTRVFKAGRHRRVVLPIGTERDREPSAGSD